MKSCSAPNLYNFDSRNGFFSTAAWTFCQPNPRKFYNIKKFAFDAQVDTRDNSLQEASKDEGQGASRAYL